MSYIKQTWVNGEKVTATKLNHLQDGIYKSNILYVTIVEYQDFGEQYYLNTPFTEVETAIQNYRPVIIDFINLALQTIDQMPVGNLPWSYDENQHCIYINYFSSTLQYNSSGIHKLLQ